jgi:hypothetical protein
VTLYSLFYLYFEFPKHDDETLSVPAEEARPIASNEVSTTSNPISSVCLQEEKAKFQKLAEAERQKRSKSTKRQKTAGGALSIIN